MADFYEVHGWPKEHYNLLDLNPVTNERKVRCAWSDRIAVANELLTTAYPYGTSLAYPYDLKIDPERNSKHADADDGKISYENAILTVLYSTFLEKTGSGDIVSESWEPGNAGQILPSAELFWSTDGTDKLEKGPQRLFPALDYVLHYYRLGGIPSSTYLLPGYINSNTVYTKLLKTTGGATIGWTPGFLLYKGARVKRLVTTGGTKLYDVQHICSYTYNGGFGWNGVWRPTTGAFAKIYDKDGAQVLLYPSTAFSL